MSTTNAPTNSVPGAVYADRNIQNAQNAPAPSKGSSFDERSPAGDVATGPGGRSEEAAAKSARDTEHNTAAGKRVAEGTVGAEGTGQSEGGHRESHFHENAGKTEGGLQAAASDYKGDDVEGKRALEKRAAEFVPKETVKPDVGETDPAAAELPAGSKAATTGKAGFGDKLKGQAEILSGKLHHDQAKVAEGEEIKAHGVKH